MRAIKLLMVGWVMLQKGKGKTATINELPLFQQLPHLYLLTSMSPVSRDMVALSAHTMQFQFQLNFNI